MHHPSPARTCGRSSHRNDTSVIRLTHNDTTHEACSATPQSRRKGAHATAAAGYLLYFAAAAKYVGSQCIGVAHSMFPAGPYRSASGSPLICPSDQGGAIDPSPYITHTGDRWAPSRAHVGVQA